MPLVKMIYFFISKHTNKNMVSNYLIRLLMLKVLVVGNCGMQSLLIYTTIQLVLYNSNFTFCLIFAGSLCALTCISCLQSFDLNLYNKYNKLLELQIKYIAHFICAFVLLIFSVCINDTQTKQYVLECILYIVMVYTTNFFFLALARVREDSLGFQKRFELPVAREFVHQLTKSPILFSDEESHECSICLSDMNETDGCRMDDCGHTFHTLCLVEWFSYRKTCPLCLQQ